MSFAQFAENLAGTLPTGIALSEERRRGSKARASQDIASILTELETFNPSAGNFNAGSQAMPEAGQTVQKPNRGYDGKYVSDLQKRFFSAASKLESLDDYAAAKKAWGTARMTKINESGMAALQAYDRGDMTGAAQLLAGASAYMSPGTTPEINVDPKSGAFVIMNYDGTGNPTGGYAVTRKDIEDMIGQNTDWNAWSERERKQGDSDRTYDLNLMKFGVEKAYKDQLILKSQRDDVRADRKSKVEVANASLDQRKKVFDLEKANADYNHEFVDEAAKFVTEFITAGDRQTKKNLDERPAGGGYSGVSDPMLLDMESGGNFAAVGPETEYGVARGRAQFIKPRFDEAKAAGAIPPGMTFEQFGTDTPEGRAAQVNAEAWHWDDINNFISSHGLEKYIDLTDPNGTPITMKGLQWAAHIAGKDGMLAYLKGGSSPNDVLGNGAAEYMKRGYEATGETAAEGGIPDGTDMLGAPTEEKIDKDATTVNDWYMTDPDESGASYPRPVMAAMDSLANDIHKYDPEANPREVALMEISAFGPEADKVTVEENPTDPELAYISNGISRYTISADKAGEILRYQDDLAGKREAIAPGGGWTDYSQAPGPSGTEASSPTPVGGAMPSPAVAPGAGSPAQAAAAAGMPGAAAAANAVAPTAAGTGIPEPAPTPGPVDDTAVRMQR